MIENFTFVFRFESQEQGNSITVEIPTIKDTILNWGGNIEPGEESTLTNGVTHDEYINQHNVNSFPFKLINLGEDFRLYIQFFNYNFC